MKKLILFIILFYLLCNCSTSSKSKIKADTCTCNQERVLYIADSKMKKSGYKLEMLYRTLIEKDTFFLIQYELMPSPNLIGGGGEIKVSKTTCKIIEKKFYQ